MASSSGSRGMGTVEVRMAREGSVRCCQATHMHVWSQSKTYFTDRISYTCANRSVPRKKSG